jgi:hypothetical protein
MGLPADGSPLIHILVLAGVSWAFTMLAVRQLAKVG